MLSEIVSCGLFLLFFAAIYYTGNNKKRQYMGYKQSHFSEKTSKEFRQFNEDREKSYNKESGHSGESEGEIESNKHLPLPDIPIIETIRRFLKSGWKFSAPFKFLATIQPIGFVPGALGCSFKGFVLINDYQLVKKAFFDSKFNGKVSSDVWTAHSQGKYGVVNTHGKVWEEQRKFCTRQLKQFGFGTKSMQPLIQTEIDAILGVLEHAKAEGVPISPNKLFYAPVLNPLWWILTGERFANEDEKIAKVVMTTFHAMSSSLRFPAIVLLFLTTFSASTIEFICRCFPFIFPKEIIILLKFQSLRDYFRQLIDNRKMSLSSTDTPRDFLDAYLLEIMNCTNTQSGFFQHNGEMNLMGVMADFFIAGGDTTANELTWCLLHLIRNPDIQREIQIEIDTVVGQDRTPTLQDRPKCPNTEAFLEEVLRVNPVALTSLPHETLEDVTLGPYFIPKGVCILGNIVGINYDPEIWGDPENFRPSRFLTTNSDGATTFVRHDAMATFSIGRKRCLGEQLARDNMFLFISSICQRFKLENQPSNKSEFPPLLEESNSGVHAPAKFWMVVRDRL